MPMFQPSLPAGGACVRATVSGGGRFQSAKVINMCDMRAGGDEKYGEGKGSVCFKASCWGMTGLRLRSGFGESTCF